MVGWRRWVICLVVVSAALVAGGCADASPGPGPGSPAGAAGRELRRALAAWSGFPVHARRRPLVLVGPDVADPPGGFPGGEAKLAYVEGAVSFPARMPRGEAEADGLPLITARQAVARFQAGAASGPPVSARLRVTTVRLGAGVFVTDRGPRRLPAWLFGFAGVRGPAAVLAAAPRGIFTPPIPAGGRPPFVDWAYLRPGGRALTVRFIGAAAGRGPCTASYSVQVASSATAVALAVQEHPHGRGNIACLAVGHLRQVTARLSAPLGARVVVDGASRTAVAVTPPAGPAS